MKLLLRAALVATLLALPGAVLAEGLGLGQLHYGVMGGGMIPVGRQGESLKRGGQLGAEIYGETWLGLQFGGEIGYTMSGDSLSTRITQLGVLARLSPTPEDYRLYVQFGLAAYEVSYHPSPPAVTHPESLVRPGGSFAVGGEFAQFSNLSIGGSGSYHGVLLQQHHALAFAKIQLHLTYRRLAL